MRNNNKLNSHMTSSLKSEPGPHWLEASAFTIEPSLLPSQCLSAGVGEHCIYIFLWLGLFWSHFFFLSFVSFVMRHFYSGTHRRNQDL